MDRESDSRAIRSMSAIIAYSHFKMYTKINPARTLNNYLKRLMLAPQHYNQNQKLHEKRYNIAVVGMKWCQLAEEERMGC